MNGAERFLNACRRQEVDRPPVWFMRQAGRSLPEYRTLRERHGFLELVQTPELAVEVTLQPVRRFGMDGAILFSDILVIAPELGIEIDFAPGPVIANPIRTAEDVRNLPRSDGSGCAPYVGETLKLLRQELDGDAAVIGFAGGPFTTAAYFVEPNSRRSPERLRSWLRADPEAALLLLQRVTDVTVGYLRSQVAAGAQAIQIFDTKAGIFSAPDFRRFVLPWVKQCVEAVRSEVPVIYIALESSHILEAARESGADVLSVDWRLPLDVVRQRLGPEIGVQGNLDPSVLYAPPEEVREASEAVLRSGGPLPGHIFNLGHGVLPDTPIAGLEAAVHTVQEWTAEKA